MSAVGRAVDHASTAGPSPIAPTGRERPGPAVPTGRERPGPAVPTGRERPGPAVPTGRERPGPAAPTGRERPGPAVPTGRERPGPAVPTGRERPGPAVPTGRERPGPAVPTGRERPGPAFPTGRAPSQQRDETAWGSPSETSTDEPVYMTIPDPVYSYIPDTGLCTSSTIRQVTRRDGLGLLENQMYVASSLPRDGHTDTGPDPAAAWTPPGPRAAQGWITARTFCLAQLAMGALVLMLFLPLLITMATRQACQTCETKDLRDQLQSLQVQVGGVADMVLNMRKEMPGPPSAAMSVKPRNVSEGATSATHRPGLTTPTRRRLQPQSFSRERAQTSTGYLGTAKLPLGSPVAEPVFAPDHDVPLQTVYPQSPWARIPAPYRRF
ncbi:hypothetical protein Bbelb_203550 [Branchiostoma belcheri]|nr:hypothetical protein Bbelb_203550 [Branchiostoma belcheri]